MGKQEENPEIWWTMVINSPNWGQKLGLGQSFHGFLCPRTAQISWGRHQQIDGSCCFPALMPVLCKLPFEQWLLNPFFLWLYCIICIFYRGWSESIGNPRPFLAVEHFSSSECRPLHAPYKPTVVHTFPLFCSIPGVCWSFGDDSMTIPIPLGPKSWTKKQSSVCPASSRPSTCWRRGSRDGPFSCATMERTAGIWSNETWKLAMGAAAYVTWHFSVPREDFPLFTSIYTILHDNFWFHRWSFPEIGIPPVIIHFGMFHEINHPL